MGRFLMITGVFVVIIGSLIHYRVSIPWVGQWIGRLPGDLLFKKGNVLVYFPFATSIVVSFILSFVLSYFWGRGR